MYHWVMHLIILLHHIPILQCIHTSVYTVEPDGSNTDGSFTMVNSNSFLSPYEMLPIAQENKYFRIFFLFYREIVCCVYS